MAILSKGTTYADGAQITSTNLNALVDSATFVAAAVESGGGVQLNGSGQLKVGGNIDIGTNALTATGAISLGATSFNENNITDVASIDVATVKSDSTDVTIDAAVDIILDAGGADILLKDDGTQFGRLTNSSSDLVVASSVSDKDILFQGNDGGSAITALTLDMSELGTANFNKNITLVDGGKALFGASSDLEIYHSGSHSHIHDTGTGNLYLDTNGVEIDLTFNNNSETMLNAVANGAVTLFYDNSAKIATTSVGITVSGDVSFTNANPEILGGDADGVMYIAPSTTKDLGGNILLYGNTHASKAKDIEIRATTGVEAHYDDSASTWDFQANAISTSGPIVTTGAMGATGSIDIHSVTGTGNKEGGQLTLHTADDYDGTYATWGIDAYEDDLRHIVGGAEVMRMEPGGHTIIANGLTLTDGDLAVAANHGISFAANAHAPGMSSELLDDYEEGTWTPTITFGGGSTSLTYDLQVGTYTKIGDLVTAACWCDLSAKGSSTGDAVLAGLPFTSRNLTGNLSAATLRVSNISFADIPMGYNLSNTATITLQESTNAGTVTNLTNSNFANTSQIMMSVAYRV
tara:strand:- start:330 stop:2066 length:1737 start_codon:yes stop_codon:yes gene_type:complete